MNDRKLKRRSFLNIALTTGAVITLGGGNPLNAKEIENNADTEHLFTTKPYLQNVSQDAITVRWITNKPCYSWVEYGLDEQLGNKAQTSNLGLIEANNRVHGITLTGLKPGSQYYYKVFSKDFESYEPYKIKFGTTIASEIYSFKTVSQQEKEVTLLILNDIHDRPASIGHLIGLNGKNTYDLVVLNGDMFNYQTDEAQIVTNLLNPCAETFSTDIPFVYLRGNHEVRGKFARQLPSYFENVNKAQYFTFTRGPVHFICLDTGEDKEDNHREYSGFADFDSYREVQAVWLKKQLKSKAFKKAKYKVVIMHIPHYHSDKLHGTLHCRALFGTLLNQHKIDLMICGHTHKHGFYPAQKDHNFPMIIGGGPKEGERTLITLKANEEALTALVIDDKGRELYKFST